MAQRNEDRGPRILVDYVNVSELSDIPVSVLKSRLNSIPELEKNLQKADKESQNLREELFSLRQELASSRNGLLDQTDRRVDLKDKDDEGQGDDEVDDEPGIAIEDQLRIKEQSAKAIEIYMSTLYSTVWQGCSKSTYGRLGCMHDLIALC